MPFTGRSFIDDCLLQPMLHVIHSLLQIADIMDPFFWALAWLWNALRVLCINDHLVWAEMYSAYLLLISDVSRLAESDAQ